MRQGQKSSWGESLPRIAQLVLVDAAVQLHPGEGGGAQDSVNDPSVAQLAYNFY